MALDPKELKKPLSKLRKLLKKMPKQPTPEQVHDLRTNTRRVEASLKALQLDRNGEGRQVLKAVTPMRKRAGGVRDMDVLTGFASRVWRISCAIGTSMEQETTAGTRVERVYKNQC
jgi:CHAD domain-containing protein